MQYAPTKMNIPKSKGRKESKKLFAPFAPSPLCVKNTPFF
jgi:hypothetical protein